jgi:secreted PhoX family phosphatase
MDRRAFLRTGRGLAAGFAALKLADERGLHAQTANVGYGPLIPDPAGILSLPAGFRYHAFSRTGERMSDGFAVPSLHDGMACFTTSDPERVILVRNHEAGEGNPNQGPFAGNAALFEGLDRALIYDRGNGARPSLGGTTNLVYNLVERRLERDYLSLVGTIRNCAGGSTPWNTWITCEETNLRRGSNATLEKDHGYNFEVPAEANGLVRPEPLVAMGRMNHEAVAVDARTWIVYQTEDRGDSLFYRFLPVERGTLARGGRLQAMALRDRRQFDTRNYTERVMTPGELYDVEWVDIEQPESPGDNLRAQGFSKGAARFSRGEGAWASPEAIWFIATDGGRARKGQIFRYFPSPYEGTRFEARFPGKVELFLEPNDASILDNPDNLCHSPWGDVFIVEDGPGPNSIRGVTLDGQAYELGRNTLNAGEMAGACFSYEGSTLFVNIQSPGITFAITGPWKSHI